MHWSSTVSDYHPVNPNPRWGFGKSSHAAMHAALDKSRASFAAVLDTIGSNRNALHAVPYAEVPIRLDPFWNNPWFSCLDAAALVSFLLERRPPRYLEIGSGHSTRFARHAIRWGQLGTKLTSIDPMPRSNIDPLCDQVVRRRLEECDLGIFNDLAPGDILFFDGSHRVFTNSDVTTFFFDVLPRLAPGILVHVHDIFLPVDYPPQWNSRLYSEQYLLGAMLLCPAQPFRVVLPNYFVCTDGSLGDTVKQIFRSPGSGPDIPFVYNNDAQIPGVSFWFETV
jgi:Methyltransferase domain